jgi:hypothetical protein
MTLKETIERRAWVLAVDPDDDGPIVTLRTGWKFLGEDAGVMGFGSMKEAYARTRREDVEPQH